MILVDSNIWVYAFEAGAPEHARVGAALPRLLESEDLLIPAVVQLEVVHFLARRLGERAGDAVDAFLSQEAKVEALTGNIVSEAARLLVVQRGTGIGGRDAAMLVVAKRNGATLASNDRAVLKVAKAMGIATTNPAAR